MVICKWLKYIRFFLSVYKNILFKDYDLIYVHYTTHSMMPLVPIWRLLKKPLIVNAHGDDLLPVSKLAHRLYALTYRSVKHSAMIVVPSKYFKEIAEEKYKHKNVLVSPSAGINLELFTIQPKDVASNSDLQIGYVSRIDTGKGWDVLLKALTLLQKRDHTIPFSAVIVGHGDEIGLMNDMIKDLDVTDRVVYLGKKPQAELPAIFNNLDVFVFPSMRAGESLGLVGLESMGCGTPVIGSRLGGIAEYVEDEINGYLFTPGNHEELAQKIIDFARLSKEEKNEMKNKALETAGEFCSHKVAKKLYEHLEAIVREENK